MGTEGDSVVATHVVLSDESIPRQGPIRDTLHTVAFSAGLVLLRDESGSQRSEWQWVHEAKLMNAGSRREVEGKGKLIQVDLPHAIIFLREQVTFSCQGSDRSGGVVWGAAEDLACWCARELRACRPFAPMESAIELGAGVGLLSCALAKLGFRRVVATDGQVALADLAHTNASLNAVEDRVRTVQLEWGNAAHVEETLRAVGNAGRCSDLIVASDCLYGHGAKDWLASQYESLEETLRALISRGGCSLVAFCWQVRNLKEELFLPRLADLGHVRIVWRSNGKPCDETPPSPSDEQLYNTWCVNAFGTWAIAVLEVGQVVRGCTTLSPVH